MIRGIGLRSGIAINVITMIGIGPLITIPLVLAQLAGPLALIGWIAGAIVALCDGLVWAELSSRYPGSGGTYVYLREIFGRDRWGRLLAFLFNWQFLLFAPCVLATGYIGFAIYLGYLVPGIRESHTAQVATAIAVGIFTILLLYRRITTVATIGTLFAVVAIATLMLVMAAAFTHAHIQHAFVMPPNATLGIGFLAGLGGALYITLYDYLGYGDAALLGDEVRNPHRTIPLAVIFSILIVAALYVALQIGILAHGVPMGNPQFIASSVVAESWGPAAARVVTVLILVTAFASVYGNLVGVSRIPYAAARDGEFFAPFAHLHPSGRFPDVALLVIGIIALAVCAFELGMVIAILTAGIVLIQGVMQIAGLFVVRASKERAPFRMWLYPLPAIVALAGWLYAFYYTGAVAIALGMGWLLVGVCAYLLTARVQRRWPFAAVLFLAMVALSSLQAPAAGWPGSAIVQRNGYPIYTVGGKPFFIYGAAFFYERIPRSQWEASLAQYRALGINTIDLYAMWNWHELRDGDFDFNGRTNSRRDLASLLRLIRRNGFKVILRPGPVIRNEWRNGGYPDWLLRRSEYNMPLSDILEGRYPATATLQNQHSDDAAAEWMRNLVHMKYASRWLRTVLRTVGPWQQDIIAIALDDDQGAYLDNQTWPAPHFQRYIGYLASVVRGVVGSHVPLFINTYDMKVTASAPVWAWGNWYQSDAYSIGEHDRSQLEFSTGLIATQPHVPVMVSEFQAGWLQGADQAWPRPADPSNTTLALNTLLQAGAHGVVNFPVQDTLNPAGWEAPWANPFYSWDAALSIQLTHQGRWLPTYRFGELLHFVGPRLAQMHVKADAAIAYLTSAYDPAQLTNDDVSAIAQATMDAQRNCRAARITCALVDLRFASPGDLQRYPALIVPPSPRSLSFISSVQSKLETYRARGGRVVANAQAANVPRPAAGGIPDAVLLVDPTERFGFLSVVNYGRSSVRIPSNVLRANNLRAVSPSLTVAPRDAALIPINVSEHLYVRAKPLEQFTPAPQPGERVALRPGSWIEAKFPLWPVRAAGMYPGDVYEDGYGNAILENMWLRVIISPCAGARALVWQDGANRENLFTTIGGMRDAWSAPLPPTARDYIGRYTHPIAAGTFNRCYAVRKAQMVDGGGGTFTYSAPDAPPHGAVFEKTVSVAFLADVISMKYHVRFNGTSSELPQQITSFATVPGTRIVQLPNAYGLYERQKRRVVMVAWPQADVKAHTLVPHDRDALLTLTFARGGTDKLRYGVTFVRSFVEAQAGLAAFAKLPPLPTLP